MNNSFLGIPLTIVSLVCFGIAVAYYFIWPKPKAGQTRTPTQQVILRYAHSLVWVLLAVACLIWAVDSQSGFAIILALAALGTYVLFMTTFITSQKMSRKGRA